VIDVGLAVTKLNSCVRAINSPTVSHNKYRSSQTQKIMKTNEKQSSLILISVASFHAPKTLRVIGSLILVAGVGTALTGLVAIDTRRAPSSIGGCNKDSVSFGSQALFLSRSEVSSHTLVLRFEALFDTTLQRAAAGLFTRGLTHFSTHAHSTRIIGVTSAS
jgi:hypothetical protein